MCKRCLWVNNSQIEKDYHDTEWGVPLYDDRGLFESLMLEGAQAGLSWVVILKKREKYRELFDNFEAKKIIKYDQDKIDSLLLHTGIVRHKLKIYSVVANAFIFLEIQKEYASFSKFIWSFVKGVPIKNRWKSALDIPTKTKISDRMSNSLKRKGFKFVGSISCYSFMQAVGLVNDHTMDCFCYRE